MFFTTTCGTRTRFKDDDEIKQASESYLESMQQEFYLTGIKKCLINVTYALVLRVIMLNNNIKILLVSFVHHIELQNFLNAPRMLKLCLSDFLEERTKYKLERQLPQVPVVRAWCMLVSVNMMQYSTARFDVCDDTGSLKISSVRKFDAGTYLCRANNSDGQAPQTRVVSVDVLGLYNSPLY